MKKKLLIKNSQGNELAVHVAGAGVPLLCISGFGCSHYNFEFLYPYLQDQFEVIMIDNRGMGESYDPSSEYELMDVAQDAVDVMKALGHEQFHLVGISMGGFVSQLLTIKYPQNVLSLQLLCTTSGGDDFIALPKMDEETLTRFQDIPEPKRTEVAIAATVHPTLPIQNPKLFNQIIELRRSHPARLEQLLKQKRAVDRFLEKAIALNEIKVPTLVLTGAEDRFVSPANALRLREKIVGSRLGVVPDTDHLFFLENATMTTEMMNNFLNDCLGENKNENHA
ncbi:MAG: hypothetical protein COW00_09570 [Bdellovibrio sp. CG12_big_fil_rev_8_21_14_0_65_39_13]|nr:MAG: hypothetical protein COW78_01575 [Bdellovibrio sp. CG22_combo_CG10-13_8_21_14_all_39_27]PIQ59627.1 MAG: hypothetical protein COW00_09570 [Bdellovibrio sp. CG12_big_fil_rev_8_21_14_0_65_39_13]PIR34498.1 MAG: hypothetical protein COV37_12855 [Bdellovibrio sp. CG11_big_fil_rev_8_21_14_0_20_39_38]